MKLKIKRFDKTIPLPVHKTAGAAAADLYSRVDIEIKPKEFAYVPMNVAIKVPKGYFAMLVPRSSTHKLGIMSANGVGVMDSDYCGDNDEYHFVAYNFTNNTVKIEKGTRLCQILLMKHGYFEFDEVDNMESPSRGGFGTTGTK